MKTLYYGHDGETVEFSAEASVEVDGQWYTGFQRDSYTARVHIEGDYVIVVLPERAARQRPDVWVTKVVEAARKAKAQGTSVVVL